MLAPKGRSAHVHVGKEPKERLHLVRAYALASYSWRQDNSYLRRNRTRSGF